jgi:hypothetical protein
MAVIAPVVADHLFAFLLGRSIFSVNDQNMGRVQ